MKTTRQGRNTERRVVVTLARHERHVTATEIINKLKRNKTYGNQARESGAIVRWERTPDKYEELYRLRPEQFVSSGNLNGVAHTHLYIDEARTL